MRHVIYISGPLTNGMSLSHEQCLANVKYPAMVMAELMENGFAPICPHLTQHVEDHIGRVLDYSLWMQVDCAIIERCDVVLRLPGASKGSDMEVQHAQELGIPVVYSVGQLQDWRRRELEPKESAA